MNKKRGNQWNPDYLKKLVYFYKSKKRMPSVAEMTHLFDYRSKSAAHYFISKLIDRGILQKDKTGRLIPGDLLEKLNKIKLLGLIEAGFPSHAEEELLDTMSLDEYLIPNPDASFVLRVKGDSMIDAGIVEGDLVIVERGRDPKPGDIVIAYVNSGYTMKYLRQKGKLLYLEPANKKYKAILPATDLKVEAVVTGIVRSYFK
jgi:SOS regulatory protein LexA